MEKRLSFVENNFYFLLPFSTCICFFTINLYENVIQLLILTHKVINATKMHKVLNLK